MAETVARDDRQSQSSEDSVMTRDPPMVLTGLRYLAPLPLPLAIIAVAISHTSTSNEEEKGVIYSRTIRNILQDSTVTSRILFFTSIQPALSHRRSHGSTVDKSFSVSWSLFLVQRGRVRSCHYGSRLATVMHRPLFNGMGLFG